MRKPVKLIVTLSSNRAAKKFIKLLEKVKEYNSPYVISDRNTKQILSIKFH